MKKDIQKLRFVDANFNKLLQRSPTKQRYAIDLGFTQMFAFQWLAGGPAKHYYVSATPWAHKLTRNEAFDFLDKLRLLNPHVAFSLLAIEQVNALNALGMQDPAGFRIEDCWTDSTSDDWHGRTDGFISLENGIRRVNRGENRTDVYVVFGFKKGQQKPIFLPEP